MEPVGTVVRPRLPLSLGLSLRMLRHGPHDPSVRIRPDEVWRATHTPDGPAAVRYAVRGDEIAVEAWGQGAAWCIEKAPDVLGARDSLDGWEPRRNRIVADLDRRFPGMRMVATHAVLEATVPTVLEQKVTSEEAHEAWRKIVWGWGEPAPSVDGIRLPPAAQRLGAEPYYRYHRFGVERKRADIIRESRRGSGVSKKPPPSVGRGWRRFRASANGRLPLSLRWHGPTPTRFRSATTIWHPPSCTR